MQPFEDDTWGGQDDARSPLGGTITQDGRLVLDAPAGLPPGPVQVILLPVGEPAAGGLSWLETLGAIQEERRRLDPGGLSRAAIDADVAAQREDREYEERWRAIDDRTDRPSARR